MEVINLLEYQMSLLQNLQKVITIENNNIIITRHDLTLFNIPIRIPSLIILSPTIQVLCPYKNHCFLNKSRTCRKKSLNGDSSFCPPTQYLNKTAKPAQPWPLCISAEPSHLCPLNGVIMEIVISLPFFFYCQHTCKRQHDL